MIEIKNRTAGCVQLIVKSFSPRREHSKAFTCLNIPGHKKVRISDKRAVRTYIERSEKWGFISTRYIPDSELEQDTVQEK